MEGVYRRSLGPQAQHTHIMWKTIHGLSNRAPKPHTQLHRLQQQNSKHTQTYCELFHQTIHKRYNITLTTSQVEEAIKQSKNNNSQGHDKLKIRHLKHIGPLGLAFLMSMFKTALNKNIIPHTWKLTNIVPIPKPKKDTHKGTSYRPISLISVIAKTLEKSLLHYITVNIPNTPMQHGYKIQHSTVTAPHTLNNTVEKCFNQMPPPAPTITVASKAFDTINIHTLL